eukprot:UN08618
MPTANYRVTTWNIRGFTTAKPYMLSLFESNEIIVINEHWLYDCESYRLGNINSNFGVEAKFGENNDPEDFGHKRGQGGVAIFWNKEIKGVSVIKNLNSNRIAGIRITEGDKDVYVIGVYMPTKNAKDTDLETELSKLDDD